jgi:ankyrin repeat protein
MQAMSPKTMRSRFIEILLSNPNINSLTDDQMRVVMAKIMEDLDKDGILDPINYDDGDWYDDLDTMSDIEFDSSRTEEEKKLALEFLQKPKAEQKEENEDVVTLESLKRIREMRRKLAEHPESGIVLTPDDFEDDETGEMIMPNSYGRSPLHEAIGMRNLDSIRKYVSEGKFLNHRDNNGNTPYQMAFQEGYEEAVAIFEENQEVAA